MDDRNLNKSLNFSNSFNFHDSINNFFNDLRYFNNLFNDSWNNNHFLNNLFYLNNLRHLNHLLNDFVNRNSNFFDSFNCSWYFNDFLNNHLDWVVLSDEVVDWLFNFDDFVDLNNFVDVSNNFNNLRNFSSFNNNLSGDFWNSNDLFLNNRHFNSSVNDFLDLFDNGDRVVDNFFNFFYSIFVNDSFFDNSNLFNGWYFDLNLNYLFNGFGNFNNLLDGLNDRDWFFYNNLDDFRNIDNMVDDFSCVSVLSDFNRFFNNTIKRLNYLNNPLNNFLLDDLNLDNFSHNSFNWNDLFSNHLDLLNLRNCVINYLFHNSWFFNFNYLLSDDLYLNDLWNLNNSLDYFLDDPGHFNDFLSVLRDFNNFFNDIVNYSDHLYRNMDDFLNFLHLYNFNWLLHNPFNRNHLRNLYHPVNNLLNNLFNFHDFGNNSENFQDVVDINDSQNFSIDHSNDSLINIKNKA